jgi:hypothetical protein
MSDVERLKEQLHQIGSEARQAAGGLADFKRRFEQSSTQVDALIAGTATGADRQITELLRAAGTAVDHAVQALEVASQGCRGYADQI